MKHRKFVKQLMSLGLDRNGAEMCAAYSRRLREPYADGMRRFCRCLQEAEAAMQAITFELNFTPADVVMVKREAEAAETTLRRLMQGVV